MNAYTFATLCFAFCSFFVGVLVWLKRRDAVGWAFLLFSTINSVWGIGASLVFSSNISYEAALLSIRIGDGIAAFIPPVWLYFILLYTRHKSTFFKLILRGSFAVASIIFLFALTPWFIPSLAPVLDFKYYTQAGPLFHVFTLLFCGVVTLSYYCLYVKIRATKGGKRHSYIGIFVSSSLAYLGGTLTFLPIYGIPFPQYGIFLMPTYPFLFAFFMIRSRFMDEEDLIKAAHRDKLATIGILAASINHEIRNPLYVIQGLADYCLANYREEPYGEGERTKQKLIESLEKISQQSSRVMAIMSTFAGFAKKNADTKLYPAPINLRELLDGILPLIKHEMELDHIELILNFNDNPPAFYADRRHMEEVFFNLILNACQAMKISGGKLTVEAKEKKEAVEISLTDNGPGISQEKLNKIFEPFFTTKGEGIGLGLYITRQLVEKNSGTITASSQPGKGTKFLLAFPKSS